MFCPITASVGAVSAKATTISPIFNFPLDTNNADYVEYQAWVDAGNTQEAAD